MKNSEWTDDEIRALARAHYRTCPIMILDKDLAWGDLPETARCVFVSRMRVALAADLLSDDKMT